MAVSATIYKSSAKSTGHKFEDGTRVRDIKKLADFEVGDKLEVETAGGRLYAYKKILTARYCRRCGFVHSSHVRIVPIRLSATEPTVERTVQDEWTCPNPLCFWGEYDAVEAHKNPWAYTSSAGLGRHPHFMKEGLPVSCRIRYVGLLDDSTRAVLRKQIIALVEDAVRHSGDGVLEDATWLVLLGMSMWEPVQRFPEVKKFLVHAAESGQADVEQLRAAIRAL